MALIHYQLLQLAREQAEKAAAQGSHPEMGLPSNMPVAAAGDSVEQASLVTSVGISSPAVSAIASSPVPVTPVAGDPNTPSVVVSVTSVVPIVQPPLSSVPNVSSIGETSTSSPSVMPGNVGVPSLERSSLIVEGSLGGSSAQEVEVWLVSDCCI